MCILSHQKSQLLHATVKYTELTRRHYYKDTAATVTGFFHNSEASRMGYTCSYMILDDESGKMWQTVVMTHFRVIFRSVPVATGGGTARIPHLQPVVRLNTSQIPVAHQANLLERWCS